MLAISRPPHYLGLGSALALFLAGPEALAEVTHEVFEVEEGGRLVLDVALGSVHVRARESDRVEVRVERRGLLPFPPVAMERVGNDVYVESGEPMPLHWLPGWAWRRIHFEVSVPARYSVDVETRRGSVRIDDVRGEVEARSGGGGLSFRHIDGPIEGRSEGGSIEVEVCSADVDVTTSGGSIRIADVGGVVSAHSSGGRVEVSNAAGDVELQSRGGPIRVEGARGSVIARSSGGSISARFEEEPEGQLETSGGSIEVWFPADEGVRLDARTRGGSIDVEHPVELQANAKGHLAGTLHGGGEELLLRTQGGSIRVLEN